MGAIAEFFMPLLFNVVFYGIGRIVIPIVSLGYLRAESAKEAMQFRMFIYDRRDDKIVISEFFTSAIGFLATIGLGVLIHSLTNY
ncbi:hypothetical protein [Duganella sp. BuS-21]|uniref:hypothetical protein n=1 Tax=Duganella sp. BuS-21 TaxID=2943848 RepID=UPI0035A5E051